MNHARNLEHEYLSGRSRDALERAIREWEALVTAAASLDQGAREALENKAWEASKWISDFGDAPARWAAGGTVRITPASNHALRQVFLYPRAYDLSDDVTRAVFSIPDDVYANLIAKSAGHSKNYINFIEAQGNLVRPLQALDWELLNRAFPWLLR